MNEIPALVVKQWLSLWDSVEFSADELRRKPLPYFYLCSIPAPVLRRLVGIQRRSREETKKKDLGIQRRHDPERSEEIRRYCHGGYPWSTLRTSAIGQRSFEDIRMPGWLPTAIVVNVLAEGDSRWGANVDPRDLVRIQQRDDVLAALALPEGSERPGWKPRGDLPPLEVIDGQHRLWAFESDDELDGNFDLPVVAFHGLDIGWQAYLFWTVNVKPKRISSSLAFDLYPLLRTQSWLETSTLTGPLVYRETRAQELTEILWSNPASPWYKRINMLGEPGLGSVTQAAFIRSLLASYVKRSAGQGVAIGGLFGSELDGGFVLPWTRVQQAAFLIFIWQQIRQQMLKSPEAWAEDLRKRTGSDEAAFVGPHNLLATDQGVRGILQVTNDLVFTRSEELKLSLWREEGSEDSPSEEAVVKALESLRRKLTDLVKYVESVARELALFDWRSSAMPGLSNETRLRQAAFRGSGGYKELRRELLHLLAVSSDPSVAQAARAVTDRLGYEHD